MSVLAVFITHNVTAEQLLTDNYANSLVAVCLGIDPIHVDPTRIRLDLEEVNELDDSKRMCIFSYDPAFANDDSDITAGIAYVGPELVGVDPSKPECEDEEWYQNATSSMCTVAALVGLPEVTQAGVMEFFHTTRPQETLRYLIGISGAEDAEPQV